MTVLVTGVAGQDGVLLARRLVAAGERVVGTVRPGGVRDAMLPYLAGVEVEELDVRDGAAFTRLLDHHRPDVVQHLAGISSVAQSWDEPELVAEVDGTAVLRMLDALVAHRDATGSAPRFVHASSAEVFGRPDRPVQDESSPRRPTSPYGCAKTFAHDLVATYRARGLHASNAILFPHESPIRSFRAVSRKITRGAAEIAAGRAERLTLGNLDVARDWGSARDHVAAMDLMARHDEPGDYVVATGVTHTLEDLLVTAFGAAGLGDPWPHVVQDPALVRPADGPAPVGDASLARRVLGWEPTETFEQVVTEMVEVEVRRLATGVEEADDYLPRRVS